MIEYKTHEIAKIIGVHPNTVRLYEKIGFISPPQRLPNGYRRYTELHVAQMRLARTAMRAEVLQNGLRKKSVITVRLCASMELDNAINSAIEYAAMIDDEIDRAKNAISSVEASLKNRCHSETPPLTRKQAAQKLGITTDTLRNWELNGLIKVKRLSNGYRVYNAYDMSQLSIIRTLRCANYSLSAILRLMNKLYSDENVSVSTVLNTPSSDEEIISVCDKLLISLMQTKADCTDMLEQLRKIKTLHLNTNL